MHRSRAADLRNSLASARAFARAPAMTSNYQRDAAAWQKRDRSVTAP
jgi:hypothetical protein